MSVELLLNPTIKPYYTTSTNMLIPLFHINILTPIKNIANSLYTLLFEGIKDVMIMASRTLHKPINFKFEIEINHSLIFILFILLIIYHVIDVLIKYFTPINI
jgi:hypothetical protein